MRHLRDWVARDGGTLWLTAPACLALDPWGTPHSDSPTAAAFADLTAAAATSGEHTLGKGRVVVDPSWTGYEKFMTGPYPIDTYTGTPFIRDVECRYVPASLSNGKSGYLYVLNRTAESRSIQLHDPITGTVWPLPRNAAEIWEQSSARVPVAANAPLTLKPYTVLLFEIPST